MRRRLYKSPRWRGLRVEVLVRDGYTCQACGGPGFEVDHVRPIRSGGAVWDPDNLQTLCRPCHSLKTASEKRPDTPGRDEWVEAVEALVQPHELVEAVAREAGGSTPDPYAALAVGILRQAVHEACREPSEFGPEARRCEAREFLGSEVAAWLIEWAGGGSGLPPGRIERFLAELPELPPGTGACRWCGVDFDARRVRTRARYCSMECRRAASNGRRRAPEEARPCSECGRGHVPKRPTRGPSYCSIRCRMNAANRRKRAPGGRGLRVLPEILRPEAPAPVQQVLLWAGVPGGREGPSSAEIAGESVNPVL